MKVKDIKFLGFLFAAMLLTASCAEVKQTGTDIGHATRDATRAIGHATRDITRDIGHGTRDVVRDVGEEVKRVTGPKSK